MASICLDFKWLCFQITDPYRSPFNSIMESVCFNKFIAVFMHKMYI